MSDWKKDIKQSVVDGALMTTGLVTLAWVGSKAGIAKPSFAPTGENLIKLFIFVSAAEVGISYAKDKKWIPPM